MSAGRVVDKKLPKDGCQMAFVSTDLRWAVDHERNIKIHVLKVAGKHLISDDRNKWRVNIWYQSPQADFSSVYYTKFTGLPYKRNGEDREVRVISVALIPKAGLAGTYAAARLRSGGAVPMPNETERLYQDVEDAIIARERFAYAETAKLVPVPLPRIIFVDRIASDNEAAELLDKYSAENR
jgi:hypothetical protein